MIILSLSTCSCTFLPVLTTLNSRGGQPTIQQLNSRSKCIDATTSIPVKLQLNLWGYRKANSSKEILAPRQSQKQVEKSFNGGTVLVLGQTVLETRAWTQSKSQYNKKKVQELQAITLLLILLSSFLSLLFLFLSFCFCFFFFFSFTLHNQNKSES